MGYRAAIAGDGSTYWTICFTRYDVGLIVMRVGCTLMETMVMGGLFRDKPDTYHLKAVTEQM